MNTTLILLAAICCPTLETFVDEIASNGSDVMIVLIICVTVLAVLLIICNLVSSYLKSKSIITFKQEEEKRFLDFCYEIAKSPIKDNLEMKKECWDLLKKWHCVSGNTKEKNGN